MNVHSFNQVLTGVSKKFLGYNKRRKKDWITLDTWKTIDRRRKAKKKAQEAKSERLKEQPQAKYSELDHEGKKRVRADKKAFMEKLGNKAEEAAQKPDMAKLYKITTSLACGFKDNGGNNSPPK